MTGKVPQARRVLHNEKRESLVLFHGDDFLAEGHDSSKDKLDEMLGAFRDQALAAHWSNS